MHVTTLISSLYGELRGYHRLSIRRRAQSNERLPREAIARLADDLFQRRVHEAIRRFPAYAEAVVRHCGSLPGAGERVTPEELPVWTRDDQRAHFTSSPRPPEASYVHQTSGSTGLPVRFYVSRECYEWGTAVTDRSYSWGQAEEGRRSVYLWAGDHATPPVVQRLKRRVHTRLQRRWYFDTFRDFGDPERRACCELINRTRPHTIVGYTAMLVDVALYASEHPGALAWKPRTLVTAAEGLAPEQRSFLEAHLTREVFMSYGSREFMCMGMECEHHNGYHLVSDKVSIEVVDADGRPVGPGETGRIVVTDLRNAASPFIRYEIGDLGVMAPPEEACPCGRPFPLLRSVEGRLQDVVHTAGGGVLTGLYITYTMRQFDWIVGYQVVQDDPGRILVRLRTAEELTPERTAPVTALLREPLGPGIAIDYERADELVRRPNGKVQLIISSVERPRVTGAPTEPGAP